MFRLWGGRTTMWYVGAALRSYTVAMRYAGRHTHTYRFTRFSAAPHARTLLYVLHIYYSRRNHALMRMQHLRT